MTKLMEWIIGSTLILVPWFAIVTKTIENASLSSYYNYILFAPFAAILLFGLISISIVMYQVYNFDCCEGTAEELRQQIKEAKVDLAKKGLKIDCL